MPGIRFENEGAPTDVFGGEEEGGGILQGGVGTEESMQLDSLLNSAPRSNHGNTYNNLLGGNQSQFE